MRCEHLARPAGAPISLATLVTVLKTMFDPGRAGDLDATLALQLERGAFEVRIGQGRIDVTPGPARDPWRSLPRMSLPWAG
ncbi:hypothetical protein DAETH_41020 (plasmid) [Deinococcus aetherius]|uniref:Uncharacterized protein n=1 Tax=Deinococcus aetherius TaxID=200252 RepID=A0ABN6RMZ0_9DEIO|nr:hypothetical protein [Deinococcus aetherius]BDP44133.1 hypothetical protein DAETH_41020 [Deinococcus aetherius]